MRTTYPGYVPSPPSGTIACRVIGWKQQQPKPPAKNKKKPARRQPKRAQPKAQKKAQKAPACKAPLRMFSMAGVHDGRRAPLEHIAVFCHSSCGVRLRPDTTDPELEFLGTANLLHKKWEVLLKATLRRKFTNAMAHVAGSNTSKAKAASTLQQKPKGKQQPRKKDGLTSADFDAAGAAPDFELTPADFELLREEFLAGEFAVQHAALAERFLREMRFSLIDPALDAAVVAEPAKKKAKVEAQRPRPQRQQQQHQHQKKVVEEEALYPLSADELAQLMEQTKGRMLQENSFLGRLSRFVRKGTADGSIVWNDERSCFITTRNAMETQCFGSDKGDVWRSLNMFGPFLTRQQCREL